MKIKFKKQEILINKRILTLDHNFISKINVYFFYFLQTFLVLAGTQEGSLHLWDMRERERESAVSNKGKERLVMEIVMIMIKAMIKAKGKEIVISKKRVKK